MSGIVLVLDTHTHRLDLDWIDLVNKGKNLDIRLYFHLENNK